MSTQYQINKDKYPFGKLSYFQQNGLLPILFPMKKV